MTVSPIFIFQVTGSVGFNEMTIPEDRAEHRTITPSMVTVYSSVMTIRFFARHATFLKVPDRSPRSRMFANTSEGAKPGP